MSGQVLIVDTLLARRLLLRVTLQDAHYVVTLCASPHEAARLAATMRPDLVLLDLSDEAGGLSAITAIRAQGPVAPPVIALIPPSRPEGRLAALRAGAEDAMDQGTPDRLLQARIRSLLRARDAAAEMAFREDEGEATFGFAEGQATFARPDAGLGSDSDVERVAVIEAGFGTVSVPGGKPLAVARLSLALGSSPRVLPPGAHPADAPGATPDLFVIDGSAGDGDPASGSDVLRLLADLRSRAPTRHAATLIVLPSDAGETAAMALDLGAGDVVSTVIRPDELAARVRALIGRKSQADRLRDRIQTRLQAAVRDPLTGLHNRRYAEPTLERMAARACTTGRDLAVMILDVDHFKGINDHHGHAAGDRVLAEVARRLRDAVRPGDLVARIGGEEFLVAMSDTTTDQARAGAERLRRVIEGTPFSISAVEAFQADVDARAFGHGTVRVLGGDSLAGRAAGPRRTGHRPGHDAVPEAVTVTLSVGVAIGAASRFEAGLTLADLLERADGALYAAKTAGRNMVAMALGTA